MLPNKLVFVVDWLLSTVVGLVDMQIDLNNCEMNLSWRWIGYSSSYS